MIARFAIPFFLFMVLIVVPLFMALLCRLMVPRKARRKTLILFTILVWALTAYGFLVGFEQFKVNHIEYASADLPDAFDGYRIVQFSDAHVGSMTGSRQWMLQRAVDSINAQQPDAIVFTGDMQNVYPDELGEHIATIRKLKAKDGVYAILGNHDYAAYQTGDETEKADNCRKTIQALRDMHLDLLLNEHRIIRRDSDSIVIAGMENWSPKKRMPRKGDAKKALAGLTTTPFTVMLEHDPSSWRDKILPACHAQLTLSGHTHGGQISLGGIRPTMFRGEDYGLYEKNRRWLNVTCGIGGVVPLRVGIYPEIVVITLRKK